MSNNVLAAILATLGTGVSTYGQLGMARDQRREDRAEREQGRKDRQQERAEERTYREGRDRVGDQRAAEALARQQEQDALGRLVAMAGLEERGMRIAPTADPAVPPILRGGVQRDYSLVGSAGDQSLYRRPGMTMEQQQAAAALDATKAGTDLTRAQAGLVRGQASALAGGRTTTGNIPGGSGKSAYDLTLDNLDKAIDNYRDAARTAGTVMPKRDFTGSWSSPADSSWAAGLQRDIEESQNLGAQLQRLRNQLTTGSVTPEQAAEAMRVLMQVNTPTVPGLGGNPTQPLFPGDPTSVGPLYQNYRLRGGIR